MLRGTFSGRAKFLLKAEAFVEGDELPDIASVDVDGGSVKHKNSSFYYVCHPLLMR